MIAFINSFTNNHKRKLFVSKHAENITVLWSK